ncbi:hypothetical protein HGP28_03930 [Vibrio sp. SM6]|uniref:Uncharacterized protein n=1 Tax=Vibrio agarilyticus TaxID=2726741 RepID=A0A7X8YG51_9VIBR|nr:hypothetical protein [Vibrio agarilyticus]NLS12041.1 hypothetical protein [Vibrio agarilyticus]
MRWLTLLVFLFPVVANALSPFALELFGSPTLFVSQARYAQAATSFHWQAKRVLSSEKTIGSQQMWQLAGLAEALAAMSAEKALDSAAYQYWENSQRYFLLGDTSWDETQAKIYQEYQRYHAPESIEGADWLQPFVDANIQEQLMTLVDIWRYQLHLFEFNHPSRELGIRKTVTNQPNVVKALQSESIKTFSATPTQPANDIKSNIQQGATKPRTFSLNQDLLIVDPSTPNELSVVTSENELGAQTENNNLIDVPNNDAVPSRKARQNVKQITSTRSADPIVQRTFTHGRIDNDGTRAPPIGPAAQVLRTVPLSSHVVKNVPALKQHMLSQENANGEESLSVENRNVQVSALETKSKELKSADHKTKSKQVPSTQDSTTSTELDDSEVIVVTPIERPMVIQVKNEIEEIIVDDVLAQPAVADVPSSRAELEPIDASSSLEAPAPSSHPVTQRYRANLAPDDTPNVDARQKRSFSPVVEID